MKCHPDKSNDLDATQKFQRLNDAYERAQKLAYELPTQAQQTAREHREEQDEAIKRWYMEKEAAQKSASERRAAEMKATERRAVEKDARRKANAERRAARKAAAADRAAEEEAKAKRDIALQAVGVLRSRIFDERQILDKMLARRLRIGGSSNDSKIETAQAEIARLETALARQRSIAGNARSHCES